MNVRGVDESVDSSSAPHTQGDLERRADVEALGTAKTVLGASAQFRADLSDWRAVLDFELAAAGLHLSPALKARFAVEDFGCSVSAYAQALVYALELPEALVYAPALVARLRRVRDRRRALRHIERLTATLPRPLRPIRQRTLALRGGW